MTWFQMGKQQPTSFLGVDEPPLEKLLVLFYLLVDALEDAVDDEEGVEDGPLGLDVLELLRNSLAV